MSRIVHPSVLDRRSGVNGVLITHAFLIDSQLDVDKLREGATKLAKKWPFLGGWLQRNSETSKIEIVVPLPEVAEIDVFIQAKQQSMKELQPSYFPTSRISIQRPSNDLSLFVREDRNIPVDEYIKHAIHAFHVNITLLTDGTVFVFTGLHLLIDGGGFDLVIKALFSIIRGDDINSLMSDDPFTPFLPSPGQGQVGVIPPACQLCGLAEFETFVKLALRDEEREGSSEQRMIYFPKSEIDRLKTDCLHELQARGITDVSFFSSAEIITAWVYKHFYGFSKLDLDRKTRIITAIDLRKRLPNVFPPDKPYLRNAVLVTVTDPLSRLQVGNRTIADIALDLRRAALAQASPDSLQDQLRWKSRNMKGIQSVCRPEERITMAINLLNFGWSDLDFSAFSIPGSGPGRVKDVYHFSGSDESDLLRGLGFIQFKDSQGGILTRFGYGSKEWASGELLKFAHDTRYSVYHRL